MLSKFFAFFTAIAFFPFHTFACTDFVIKAEDKAVVVGRSMEFGEVLPVQIQTFPKGEAHASRELKWSNKHAYTGMVLNPSGAVVDGFNEAGLSVGALWMPGTQYPEPASGKNSLFFADVPAWLLGNFATVQEAKQGLSQMSIAAGPLPGFPSIPPIHLSLHDAKGDSLVVEFLEGKMHLFDNPVGVLTNAPEFPWHVTNLRNYISLSAFNKGAVNIDGTILEPTGQGNGLLGIPGDWTPPSRFVKTAFVKQALEKPQNAKAATLAAIHLLNAVDIPRGAIRAEDGGRDYTQWIVVKDLTNQKLYYRTYENPNVHQAELGRSQPLVLDVKP